MDTSNMAGAVGQEGSWHQAHKACPTSTLHLSDSPASDSFLGSETDSSLLDSVSSISDSHTTMPDYQAVGCLRVAIDSLHLAVVPDGEGDWQEATEIEELLPRTHILYRTVRTLLKEQQIRVTYRSDMADPHFRIERFYIRRRKFQYDENDCYAKNNHSFQSVFNQLDSSNAMWKGRAGASSHYAGHKLADKYTSLFYLFNTLPSPAPAMDRVHNGFDKAAMNMLMASSIPGLKAMLHPYQRRSAALMLQREVAPEVLPDPNYEEMCGPDNSMYYYNREMGRIMSTRSEFEQARGGILAETMGLGKTLICLGLILATKGHWSLIPPDGTSTTPEKRTKVASLYDICLAEIGRKSVPWKSSFTQHRASDYSDDSHILKDIKKSSVTYIANPKERTRQNGRRGAPTMQEIRLSTTTIVVCPANLIQQWRNEIHKHCEPHSLKVLVLTAHKMKIPAETILVDQDLILMSHARFQKEEADSRHSSVYSDGKWSLYSDKQMKGINHERSSPDRIYRSPLLNIHWKRIIIDEGHTMAAVHSDAVHFAGELLADRRWVVSGTPVTSLIGIEVHMSAMDTGTGLNLSLPEALEKRKISATRDQEEKDLMKLEHIAQRFLKAPFWRPARNLKLTTPEQVAHNRASLQLAMGAMIVKHRPEDVEVELPPIYNKVVRLEASFYDRLSFNIFVLFLNSNAVTSERDGIDYLFHPQNRKAVNELVSNLRESMFYWTGSSVADVANAVKHSREYLEEHPEALSTDVQLLKQLMLHGDAALADEGWKALHRHHDLGLFVSDFPASARSHWSLDSSDENPGLVGAAKLPLAQRHVNSQAYDPDPCKGLADVDFAAKKAAGPWQHWDTMGGKTSLKNKLEHSLMDPMELRTGEYVQHQNSPAKEDLPHLKSSLKKTQTQDYANTPELPKTAIIGTASAKLSYLVERILDLQNDEKILVAYDGVDTAYYISQTLDLAGVKHLIYAGSLSAERRARYLVTFNTTETFRVFLLDIRQASHGLNLSSASRVFFVNPIWQPDVEAQAIKRAHRIGQTKPVYVETLVLRDTLEDKMLDRRNGMTHEEHEHAQKSILDDGDMKLMVQSLRPLPLMLSSSHQDHMAPLKRPIPVFGDVQRSLAAQDPDADLVDMSGGGLGAPNPEPGAEHVDAGALVRDEQVVREQERMKRERVKRKASAMKRERRREEEEEECQVVGERQPATTGYPAGPSSTTTTPSVAGPPTKKKKVARFVLDDEDLL